VSRAGLVLALAGVAATLAAQLSIGNSWRVGVDPHERTTLVTTGPFALACNPVSTAMTATSAGLALMVPNPISLAATAVLVASIQLRVRAVEEPCLARTHGSTHTAYAVRVGRFWPASAAAALRSAAEAPPSSDEEAPPPTSEDHRPAETAAADGRRPGSAVTAA
jgi:protein-S-isoprenylcysteine O-methyltransferase Ste14